jgi:hypothetical protein
MSRPSRPVTGSNCRCCSRLHILIVRLPGSIIDVVAKSDVDLVSR